MNLASQSEPPLMVKKPSSVSQRRRPARPARGVRLREEFRSYARAVILEAGEDVLATQGLHAAKMEEVAQKARVAVGTIYNLIGDRDALVVEIMRLRHEQIVALVSSTMQRSAGLSFRAQSEACLSALLGYFREHRRFYRMALESEGGPACEHKRVSEDTLGEIRGLFRDLVTHGVETGVLRADSRDLSARLLMGMMREAVMLDVETQHPSSPDARASEVLSIFIDGAGVK